MSFWDHLEELRGTIFRSLIAVVILSIAVFCLKRPVFSLVFAPAGQDFFLYRWLGMTMEMDIINVDVTAQFMTHMKMAFSIGFILSIPYIIYEIWRFIAPALYENEKKAVNFASIWGGALFYLGIAVGYVIIVPLALNFFMNYSVSDAIRNTITLQSYISLFNSTLIAFGLVFEFPIVVVILSALGIIDRAVMKKYRRYAIVAILIVAALVTPADPLSMCIAAVPLYLLYEVSVLFCAPAGKEDQE